MPVFPMVVRQADDLLLPMLVPDFDFDFHFHFHFDYHGGAVGQKIGVH